MVLLYLDARLKIFSQNSVCFFCLAKFGEFHFLITLPFCLTIFWKPCQFCTYKVWFFIYQRKCIWKGKKIRFSSLQLSWCHRFHTLSRRGKFNIFFLSGKNIKCQFFIKYQKGCIQNDIYPFLFDNWLRKSSKAGDECFENRTNLISDQ